MTDKKPDHDHDREQAQKRERERQAQQAQHTAQQTGPQQRQQGPQAGGPLAGNLQGQPGQAEHLKGTNQTPHSPVDEAPGKYGNQGRPIGDEPPPVPEYAFGQNPPGTNPPFDPPNDPATTPVPGSLPPYAAERQGGQHLSQDQLEQKDVPKSDKGLPPPEQLPADPPSAHPPEARPDPPATKAKS